jgi:F-type H+-transporting ATPase subunit b
MDLTAPELWVAVSFLAFVALAGRAIWRQISAALDGRAARIRAQIEEAEKLRAEAERLLSEYKEKQRQALADAEAILAQAKDEAKAHRERSAVQLDAALKRREQQALDRISQAEAQALSEVRSAAADLAVAATRRLIETAMDAKARGGMIDAAIKELPQKLH